MVVDLGRPSHKGTHKRRASGSTSNEAEIITIHGWLQEEFRRTVVRANAFNSMDLEVK